LFGFIGDLRNGIEMPPRRLRLPGGFRKVPFGIFPS